METYLIKEDKVSLNIDHSALEAMIAHGEEGFPNEICGFMFGNKENGRKITIIRRAKNIKEGDQRRRFEISPLEYHKAEIYALENELDLLGIYHTHPNHPAIPSIHDLKQALPVFSYIILSIQEGKFDHIRSWKIDENSNKFIEEQILT